MILPGSASTGRIEAEAAKEVLASGWNVQRLLGGEVQRRVVADTALEVTRRGGGPGDGVLLLVPADALQGQRGPHEVLVSGDTRN